MSRENDRVNPFTVIIIIISMLMIGSMVRNAISLYQARSRLDTAKQAVVNLESEKQNLANQIAVQTDPAALDLAIRNKLNLVQPGETIVVIAGTGSATISPTPAPETPNHRSTFLHWWQILNPKRE
jgi:cell division protein FtsB